MVAILFKMKNLNLFLITHPICRLVFMLFFFLVIRIICLQDVSYCEGWTLNFTVPSAEEVLMHKQELLKIEAEKTRLFQERVTIKNEIDKLIPNYLEYQATLKNQLDRNVTFYIDLPKAKALVYLLSLFREILYIEEKILTLTELVQQPKNHDLRLEVERNIISLREILVDTVKKKEDVIILLTNLGHEF